MESRVKIFGHPVHPMLIVFPIGLLATAVIFDILYLASRNPDLSTVSFYMITAWIGGELVYRLGVGVDPGAHVNAPNSLTTESASGTEPSRQTKRTANR